MIPSDPLVTSVAVTSDAGYVQGEAHLTSQLDLIGGYRYSHDTKLALANVQGLPPTSTFGDSKPSYLIDLDYKPFQRTLFYGKYSTAYISGGSAFGLDYAPETAESYEIGAKSDLLDRRLRADIAIYEVTYKDLQDSIPGFQVGLPEVGAALVNNGSLRATGFEFEGTALPVRGVTLSVGTGYTNAKFIDVSPLVGTTSSYMPLGRPHWTANVSSRYETLPLFGESKMSFQVDAPYRGKEAISTTVPIDDPALSAASFSGEAWVVNGRVTLNHLPFAYGQGEVALWARNIFNDRSINYGTSLSLPFSNPFLIIANFQQARAFGVDVTYDFQ